jgi:hypothetical protein
VSELSLEQVALKFVAHAKEQLRQESVSAKSGYHRHDDAMAKAKAEVWDEVLGFWREHGFGHATR